MQQEALYTITNGLYVLASCGGGQSPKAEGNNAAAGNANAQTSITKGRFSGSLVDAVSQIAVNPNLIIVSCMNNSCTKECIEKTGEFSLSVLPQDTSPETIATFGFQTSREVDKWEKANAVEIGGLPYIADALAKIRAKVVSRLEYPCNTVFIAEVVDAFDVRAGEPLTYKYYRDAYKEKALAAHQQTCASGIQAAAQKEREDSGREPQTKAKGAAQKRWTCTLCGYVYEGDIPFEELPDDWRCPLCGVGKDMFELQ